MKKTINLGKKLSLTKAKLDELNDGQLAHFMGGRMAATTSYTANGAGNCSVGQTSCCSTNQSACCA